MLFKNKHLIVAMLVAPVLALIAYFATDFFVKEKPQKALSGKSYEMIERPNCRWASSQCELKNGNFHITVKSENAVQGHVRLNLSSNFSLQGVKIALIKTPESDPIPVEMDAVGDAAAEWTTTVMLPETDQSRLRLVIAANDSLYYAETSTAFFRDDRQFKH